jgi:hypothetical protein
MVQNTLRAGTIAICTLLGCTTDMGIEPATNAGYGNIVVWEKNGFNARVYLDYRPTDLLTPVTLENVPAGNHTVHLFYENYASVSGQKVLAVMTKANSEAEFELQKSPSGELTVETDPSGAMVTLNNVDFGVSPLSIKGLPSGTYTVGARLGNYRANDVSVAVSPTADPQPRLSLKLSRSVVIEYFSNTNCAGCPAADAAVQHLLEQLPQYKDQIFKLSYHVGFPNQNDPFYLAVKDDQNARMTLYNVLSAPAIYCNGVAIKYSNETAFITEAKKRIEALVHDTAVTAELSFKDVSTDALKVSGTIVVKGNSADTRIFVALVGDFIGYDTPLGTNEQRLFHAIFKGFAEGANSVSVFGAEMEFPFYIKLPSSNPSNEYSLIAFLQDAKINEILQSQRISIPR